MLSLKMITLASAAAVLAASAPASAEVKSKPVYYSDLDLSSSTGQQRLATRIKSAAKSVCDYVPTRSLAEQNTLARCISKATISAAPQVERTITRFRETKQLAANVPSAVVGN